MSRSQTQGHHQLHPSRRVPVPTLENAWFNDCHPHLPQPTCSHHCTTSPSPRSPQSPSSQLRGEPLDPPTLDQCMVHQADPFPQHNSLCFVPHICIHASSHHLYVFGWLVLQCVSQSTSRPHPNIYPGYSTPPQSFLTSMSMPLKPHPWEWLTRCR